MQKYVAVWANGNAEIVTHEEVKFPAEKVKDCIAIVEIQVQEDHGVDFWTYYRENYVSLNGYSPHINREG